MTTPATLQALADELAAQRAALQQLDQRLRAMASVVEDLLLQEMHGIHEEREA